MWFALCDRQQLHKASSLYAQTSHRHSDNVLNQNDNNNECYLQEKKKNQNHMIAWLIV